MEAGSSRRASLILIDFEQEINQKWKLGAPGGIPIDFD